MTVSVILLIFPWALHSVSGQVLIFVGQLLLWSRDSKSGGNSHSGFCTRPAQMASAEPHCHLLEASSKQLRQRCQILWDAFVLQNTRQTAINQHLLKLILTRSLTFTGITRHSIIDCLHGVFSPGERTTLIELEALNRGASNAAALGGFHRRF